MPETATAPAVLVLQRNLWSQNDRDRAHFRQHMADRDAWIVLLRAAVLRCPVKLPRATGHRRVHIQSIRRQLCRDDSNLRGGAKGLSDALVRVGLLRDDSDKLARITYGQETCRGRRPQVIVTVWPEGA